MKQIGLGFATLLLGSSLIYGYDTESLPVPAFDPPDQNVVSPDGSYGLTPKRPQTATTVQHVPVPVPAYPSVPFAVEPPPAPVELVVTAIRAETPVFLHEAIGNNRNGGGNGGSNGSGNGGGNIGGNGGVDPYFYAELERLSSAIDQLQKDTAKPDPSKSFSTPRLSGRMFFDSYTIDQPKRCEEDGTNFKNKAGLKELRLGITGTGYSVFDYKAEITLATATVNTTTGTTTVATVNLVDGWIGAKNVPGFGYLRVGHFLVENGITILSGTTNTTSTRSLPPNGAFSLSRRLGVGSEHLFANDRIRWFYGIFQGEAINASRYLKKDDQGPIFNTRLTMVPYYAEGGKYFLHFGGHYTYVAAQTDTGVSTSVGSGWGLGDTLKTGTIHSNHHHRTGVELVYQRGPFGVMSEAYFARYGAADQNRMATGASVEFSYFLTGEHRAYNLATGTVGAVQMKHPFQPFTSGGWNLVKSPGAWQVFTQYGYTDLGDWRGVENATGGLQHDLTFGVNWFWTSNIRMILEYTHSQQNTGDNYKYCYQDIFGASARVSW